MSVLSRAAPVRLGTAALVVLGAGVGALAIAPPARADAGVITGHVWNDANRNGVLDAGEAPFPGMLLYVLNSDGVCITSVQTASDGSFSVTGLADGTYAIEPPLTTWDSYRDTWTPTTKASLRFAVSADVVDGSGEADLGLRQVVRSTDINAPLSTATTPGGIVVRSYDDVVSAADIVAALSRGTLEGPEQRDTSVYFDYGSDGDATMSVAGSPGSFTGYQAWIWVPYDSWLDNQDAVLFHEYGHAWSYYYAYLVQQDPTFSAYLHARGVAGDPRLNSSKMWTPAEMIAEDYRQLFGSPNAAAYPQANTDLPPAADVPGLKTFLSTTYMQPPAASVTAPTVTSVSPGSAPAAGGLQVTVTGSNFGGNGASVSEVTVGGVAAGFAVSSPTELTVTLPPGSGQQHVVVMVADGSATATSSPTSADLVTYVPAPAVTGLSPTSGGVKGGTKVTVSGSGFTGPGVTVQAVYFGSARASSFTVASSGALVAVTPPVKSTGAVDVTVVTSGGTSGVTSADRFTYTRR